MLSGAALWSEVSGDAAGRAARGGGLPPACLRPLRVPLAHSSQHRHCCSALSRLLPSTTWNDFQKRPSEHLPSIIYPLYWVFGEGNGTPLQSSCLETPMDGGAWWAAVHGVAKSRTRLSNFTFTFTHWRRKWQPTPVFLPGDSHGRKWQPTPVFLPGDSQGWESLVGCRLWGRTESDTTEAMQQQQQQQQQQQ